MGSLPATHFNIKKIAIIGGGPCGLCAARYLRAQGTFDSITVFEQQPEVGGVWNYTGLVPEPTPLPQLDPFLPPDAPVQVPDGLKKGPVFPSPMYEKLHANIPNVLMQFSDKAFPETEWLFPRREAIQQYLVEYAEEVRHLIKFSFQVNDVNLEKTDQGHDKWRLKAQSTVSDEVVEEVYDAVVVANGHYTTPYVPAMKNMKEFHERHPTVISHSKNYRSSAQFRDKKVIVVGNGPSGTDIALQINSATEKTTLISGREPTNPGRLAHTGCEEIGEIVEFLPEERGVRLIDGTVVTDVDAVVFCTGFLFSYPFLPGLNEKLLTSGKGVHGLYKHLFHIEHPTLVFPGLNIKTIPWPFAETQAAVVCSVWSNQVELPSVQEMNQWSQELEKTRGGDALHVMDFLDDGRLINEMHDFAMKAPHVARTPPRWDNYAFWMRSLFVEAKLRFEIGGCKAKSFDDLGFEYDDGERFV